ncbi:major facilitator superfamily domain-containing protein 6 isoform X2 [Anabrus simplex]|uniref:major facilitator superfamily domain-containing protein 6 isoform X2 n=1 Tax=Anabrus simplex TaxID=316456 RepID=UPI0035A2E79C
MAVALLNINLDLLPMKAQFFLWNAGTAPIVPFLTTYARQLGFSSFIVGTIYLVLPVMGMLAKPLFGAVADRYQCQKLLFLIFQVVTAASFFIIQFIPEITSDTPMVLGCHDVAFLNVCKNTTADNCLMDSVYSEIENEGAIKCEMHCKAEDQKLWGEVCKTWDVPEACNNNKPVSFGVQVEPNKTLKEKNCLFLRISKAEFSHKLVPYVYCSNFTSSTCDVKCQNPAITEFASLSVSDSQATTLYQFWVFFGLLISSWIGMAVVVSLGDAICFGMLGDNPSRYGQQRLWGAVGWGIFSVIAGVLVDEFSRGQTKKDYTSIFYLMLIMLVLDMLVSSRLKYSQTKLSSSIVKDVGKLVTEPHVVVFMLWIVTVGLCTGLLWQFLFWHLEDLALAEGCDMQYWVKTLEGLVMGVQCFGGELPFFFLSGRILKKIGHVHAMTLVLLGIAVRFILYSVLSNPWWCLPIELFQGITFGIFYATMASYASIVAPPGTEATVQGLVGALFEGIGVSLGSLLGGTLFGLYGGGVTFRIYGLGALVMFFIHAGVQYFLSSRPRYNIQPKDFDSSARYAAPNEAIQILEDELQLTCS